MLYKIFISTIIAATLASCSTVYKSTQTPDDVYYSPSRPVPAYEEREESRDEIADNYNAERREIMMGIYDRRWRYINDPFAYSIGYNNIFYNPYSYYNSPYNYCFNNGWGSYYGYYYNPYYYPYPIYNPIITKPQPAIVTTPRMVNLNAYNGYNRSYIPAKDNNVNWSGSRRYNNSNTQKSSRVGTIIREALTPSSNRSNSNDTRSYNPSRSDNNSSNSGRSSSSPSNNSGGVSRPGRGG